MTTVEEPPALEDGVRLSRRRRAIGRRMRESVTTKPPVTLHTTAPADAVVAATSASGKAISINGLVAHAAIAALGRHPALNAHIDGDRTLRFEAVQLGVAVDVPEGLVVPVIHDADRLDPAELTAAIANRAVAARAGDLRPDDVTGGTFTISALGALGVEQFTPILNPPEVAVLGIGALREAPAWRDGSWVPAPVLHLSLTFDHAAVDGAPAARYLADVVATLSEELQ